MYASDISIINSIASHYDYVAISLHPYEHTNWLASSQSHLSRGLPMHKAEGDTIQNENFPRIPISYCEL